LTLLAEYDNSNYVEKREAHCGNTPRAETAVPRKGAGGDEGRTGMRRRYTIFGVTACAVAVLGLAPSALAATPQQIYRDYAQHGRLTHNYSRSDLQRALRDAALQGYPRVGVQGAVQQALGAQAVKSRGGLPFTGLDLALMTAGGAALLAAGTGLRALGRAKK
jgi:hypothetical protein